MWNQPSKKELSKIPLLYTTESIPLHQKEIYLHFFIGGCDWYVCEVSEDHEYLWGFVILSQDYKNAEWGYISLSELKSLRIGFTEVDCDLYWKKRPAMEVLHIRKCHPHWYKYDAKQGAVARY